MKLSKFYISIIFLLTVSVSITANERDDYKFAFDLFTSETFVVAKSQFETFIRKYPKSENADDAQLLIAECSFRLDLYDEAIAGYRRLIVDYPESALKLDALRGIAETWFRQGKYEEAIKGYEEVIATTQTPEILSETLYFIGEAYDSLGLYQKAGEFYDRVISQFPDAIETPNAIHAKAWTFYRLKNYRSAHDLFSGFAEKYPKHFATADADYYSAESLFKLGDWARSEIAFQKFIDRYQTDPKQYQLLTDARFRLGECLFQQQKMDAAKDQFLHLVNSSSQISSDSETAQVIAAQAQYWIGQILATQDKTVEAIYELEKVSELYPKSSVADNAQYSIGMINFKNGDYAKARAIFKAVADDPRSDWADAARFRMGECFRMLREFNSAILNYKKVKGDEYSDDAIYQIGISYFELRDHAAAADAFQKLIDQNPKSKIAAYALYHLGIAHFKLENFAESSSAFDQYANFATSPTFDSEIAPPDEALFWKARSLYKTENYNDTIETCNRLIADFPKSDRRSSAEFLIAESHYWLGDYPTARKIYQQSIDQNSDHAEKSIFGLGWTYFSEKNYRGAIKAWKDLNRKFPNGDLADQAQFQIGVAHSNQKEYKNAIATFEKVKAIDPSSEWRDNSQYQIGWAWYKLENYNKAIQAYRSMINNFPASDLKPNAIFGIANAHFKNGRYRNAIGEYRKVVEDFPNLKVRTITAGAEKLVDLRPEAQYYIAECYMNLNDLQQSISAYTKVIDHYPKSKWADDAQYSIAIAYENSGQQEKALEAYRKLTKNYRSSPPASDVQIQIGRSYFNKKDYKRAISEFQKVIQQFPKTASADLAQFNIGRSYLALASFKQAISAFQKISPNSDLASSAKFEIGKAWFEKKNPSRSPSKAIAILTAIPQQFPKSSYAPQALLIAGESHTELLQYNEAIKNYKQIVSKYPKSDPAQYAQLALAHAYRTQKNFLQAIDAYEKIRAAGTDHYRIEIVVEAELHLAETQSAIARHYDAGVTYLRVRHLREKHSPITAMHAAVRAGDAFDKAEKIRMARDAYADALKLFESYAATAKNRSEWDQLNNYAQNKYQQVVSKIEQE